MIVDRTSVLTISLCCSLNFMLVEGLYILQVQLIGYSNPTQRRFGGSPSPCCDGGLGSGFNTCTSGDKRCDTFFIFCLRPLYTPGFGCDSNSGSMIQSGVNWNDTAIDFSQSTFLGLNNPVNLTGLTDVWNISGVQLSIDIRDWDSEETSQRTGAVFWVIERTDLSIGESSGDQILQGDFVTITVNYRVLCAQNFQGFDCTECISGFIGAMCDENIDDCMGVICGDNQRCIDGIDSFTCVCNPGFTGVNCSGNEVCVDGVTCPELQSSVGVQTGPIVGGILGALISLIFILVIVVSAVVLTMRCLNRQGKEDIQGKIAHSDGLPGDNPVYERGNTAVTLGAQSSAPVHYVNLSSNDRANMAGSEPDRVFDNPIYGGNDEETEDMYADPDTDHHAGTRMGSAPYHEFDNPIYGGEPDENAYSLLADSSTVNGTAASNGQMMFINTKRGTLVIGNEQTYDHVDY